MYRIRWRSYLHLGFGKLIGYIYRITNTINGKVYIGKTTTPLETRWAAHLKEAKRESRQYKSKLYEAMNKYGVDKFVIEVIEECERDMLDERECHWIKEYDSQRSGYNITAGGDGHNVLTEDDINEFIILWAEGYTIKEISVKTGRAEKIINRTLRLHGVSSEEIDERRKNYMLQFLTKPIYFYDLDGNFIAGFPSGVEASRALGIHKSSINHVLHGRQKSIHGMMIRDFKAERIDKVSRRGTAEPHNVFQYSIDGDYIGSYPSLASAARAVGLKDSSGIRNSCNGQNTASAGYQWRFFKKNQICGLNNLRHHSNSVESGE